LAKVSSHAATKKASKKQLNKTPLYTSKDFFLEDYPRTLFPLQTNRVLVEAGAQKLLSFAYEQTKGNKTEEIKAAFLAQKRVCAMKVGWHLRRTFKLDPVAEIFLYDLVFRNRNIFRKPISDKRECFGYRFADGKPLDATSSYKAFKGAYNEYADVFRFGLSFDVASYFNSIYHHDLVAWFDERNAAEDDVATLGKFLREINSGRSIDCLPQGLYPSKMIGNDFLKFLDNSGRLRSNKLIRFMDDVALFSNNREDLLADFYVIQDLLGQKGLSVNPSKTFFVGEKRVGIEEKVDAVRKGLLKKRRRLIITGYDVDVEETEVVRNLTAKEVASLKGMLTQPNLDEEDAELVLALMGSHSEDVLARFGDLLREFPNLAKNMHVFSRNISERAALAKSILDYVKGTPIIPEYQLFWLGKTLEDYLLKSESAGDLLMSLYNHPWATAITKAKILEIPDNRFGLPELREEQLKEGKSDWLAWSAAVGSRVSKKASRNYVLNYFKNASPINSIIAEIVSSLP
jgi:hypothetical protein